MFTDTGFTLSLRSEASPFAPPVQQAQTVPRLISFLRKRLWRWSRRHSGLAQRASR
jgi:hypothetical protein